MLLLSAQANVCSISDEKYSFCCREYASGRMENVREREEDGLTTNDRDLRMFRDVGVGVGNTNAFLRQTGISNSKVSSNDCSNEGCKVSIRT